MADLNECRWQALTSILAHGGHVSDLLVEYVTSLVVARYPSETPEKQVSDLWNQLFILDGFKTGYSRNDREYAWLKAEGATGDDLSSLWEDYWCNVAGGAGGGAFDDGFSDGYA